MNQIEKLKKVLAEQEVENEKVFDKSSWCRTHNFKIQAEVLMNEYDVVRKVLRQIKMKVVDETIDV